MYNTYWFTVKDEKYDYFIEGPLNLQFVPIIGMIFNYHDAKCKVISVEFDLENDSFTIDCIAITELSLLDQKYRQMDEWSSTPDILKKSIEVLKLDPKLRTRILNALRRSEVKYLGDFLNITTSTLFDYPGFGRMCMIELVNSISEWNIFIVDDGSLDRPFIFIGTSKDA